MEQDLAAASGHTRAVQAASTRWWSAQEGGAPVDEVQRLWEDLARLCGSRPAPQPEDDAASRFGWLDVAHAS
ncbi:MAG: hypothetical protein JWP95_2102 [Actinotalea sp.]|nr:hypothetical protein [Actinotalea sp.]